MLFAMLFYYIFTLYSSGGSDGLVLDITKPVKQYVHDAAKAKQIISVNAEMMSEEAAFEKDEKKAKKQLAKLNSNRLSSEAELNEVFSTLDQKRADARVTILDRRFKMKEMMTAAEWNSVYATAGPPK